ncbi:MAG TPA: glycosyltransferase family 9 protein [Cytophagales bacterium]|nr:glycosyltransferase family 9 protein [Cytophagales bacterium]
MGKKKFLILRFSSIGDIVLTTPVIRAIKTQVADSEVHFCTKKNFEAILKSNPYVDKLHLLEKDLDPLIKNLKQENFDYVIDLHKNLRTSLIKLRLGAKSRSFDKLNFEKWLYVNLKVDKMPNVHIVDRYMETVSELGVKNDGKGLDYFIPEDDEISVESLPETHRKGYVAYAIGANHNTKKLPVHKMIELCEKISRPVILLGGKDDVETGEKVKAHFDSSNSPTVIFNGCGKYKLNQSSSLLKQADLVFSHDTGLMHIASAFKKKIYSIWGNTTPQLGMYPYQTPHEILEVKGLSCRPCSKLGYPKCPLKHFKCMNDQVFDL